jgi:fumarate hydratase class I
MKALTYPFTKAAIGDLRVGDTVRLSGLVFTGRDRFHRSLAEGGACPVDLRDGALFHCGPIVLRQGSEWVVKAAGPTTSIRQEPYMAAIIRRYGVRVIIGKGGMGDATRRACEEIGCIYVQLVGGAAALAAGHVAKVGAVHFLREFGAAEAVWELVLRDLEGVVTMDAHGGSLHDDIARRASAALCRLLSACGRSS